jgi:uncharacterized protein (DUF2252 family)
MPPPAVAARPSRLVKRRTNAAALQCCGDAHLSNFGVFAAPDRHLVFDLTTLTRRCAAPFEWAVKRLVASFVVAARDNGIVATSTGRRRARPFGSSSSRP